MENKTLEEQNGWIIKKMFGYASEDHQNVLNKEAFKEIATIFLNFIHSPKSEDNPTRWVCNAPMGHGKTTVLKSLCKYVMGENTSPRNKKPLLIVIREKGEGKSIADELLKLSDKYHGKIKYITSDNKANIASSEIKRAQIVIITHARFRQLAMGCGDMDVYSQWEIREKANYFGVVPASEQYNTIFIPRSIIVDEMPEFINASTFDIGSSDNCIEWFDNLVEYKEIKDIVEEEKIQHYRTLFNGMFNKHTYNEKDETTYRFLNDSMKTEEIDEVNNFYDMVEGIDDLGNKIDFDTYKGYLQFKRLVYEDGAGKIYHQYYKKTSDKIIVAEFIDYANINQQFLPQDKKVHQACRANILVLDGTGRYSDVCYKKANFEPHIVRNYNDYTRLTLHHRDINTSSHSREKEETVLNEILFDYQSLKKKNDTLFLLPAKNDISFFIKKNVLSEENVNALTHDETVIDDDNILHILNTRGKNKLKDVTDLYLTCLPRKSAAYYATIAIAVYGSKNVDIRLRNRLSDDDPERNKDSQWFNDDNVELIYKLDLAAELLQILHRTALRKINSKTNINIYMAFEDITDEDEDICRVFRMMRAYFTSGRKHMENDSKYTYEAVYNGSIYGRNQKIEMFSNQIKQYLYENESEKIKLSKNTLGDLGVNIIQFFNIHKNWEKNKEAIIDRFAMNGIKVDQKSPRIKMIELIVNAK